MQTTSTALPSAAAPYRFTVDEYLRMAEVGLLAPDVRTELVDGQVVVMSPKNLPHTHAKTELRRRIELALGLDSELRVLDQDTLRATERDAPEPDIAVVPAARPPLRRRAIPRAADAVLLIEVSDTTLGDDLGRKQALYAMAGVRHYWVADVNARVLHQFANPHGGEYRLHEVLSREQSADLEAIGLRGRIALAEIFPEYAD